jgi:ERCC4-type nuclease
MAAGDFAFQGRGEGERPVPIGIEYKTIGDLMSCIMSARFSDVELPGLISLYEHSWLLVEGYWKPDEGGKLVINNHQHPTWGKKIWMYADVVKWLTTIEMKGRIHIARTGSKQESAFWVKALYTWWTSKAWEDHDAHRQHSKAALEGTWTETGLVERWASCLSGVGPKRAREVSGVFETPLELAEASVASWRAAGLGPKTAEKVHKQIRGE